jgi:hypothetical protein
MPRPYKVLYSISRFTKSQKTPNFTTKAPSHKEYKENQLFIEEFFLVSSCLGGERSLLRDHQD